MTKLLMVLAASCVMGLGGASAQTSPTKPSSGDPAATPPSNPSGSGTSTGMDANGDQGRDKMGTTGRARINGSPLVNHLRQRRVGKNPAPMLKVRLSPDRRICACKLGSSCRIAMASRGL